MTIRNYFVGIGLLILVLLVTFMQNQGLEITSNFIMKITSNLTSEILKEIILGLGGS